MSREREPLTAQSGLRCPKCHGRMQTYERTGIVVEQCEDCRGIFLDSGELERLIDAEGGGWSGRIGPPTPAAAGPRPARTTAPAAQSVMGASRSGGAGRS